MSVKTAVGALLLLGGVVGGCNEPPSFRARWCINARDSADEAGTSCRSLLGEPGVAEPEDPAATTAKLCAQAGVREVEILTFDPAVPAGDGFGQRFVDRRIHPCSPRSFVDPTAMVTGPRLDPGIYNVMIRGMNGEQRGWFTDVRDQLECDDEGEDECPDGYACQDSTCRPVVECQAEYSESAGGRSPIGEQCPAEFECVFPTDCNPDIRPADGQSGLCTGRCEQRLTPDDFLWCSDDLQCVVEELNDDDDYVQLPGLTPLVCACDQIEIRSGSTVEAPMFELSPPPECEDGIDNDRDGLVDVIDPGCGSGDLEGTDTDREQLSLEITLLDRNPHATCRGVGIGSFVARLADGTTFTIPCDERPVPTNLVISIDAATTLEVVGVGAGAVERTITQSVPIEPGRIEPVRLDFGPDAFLEPIEARAELPLRFEHDPAGLRPTVLRSCDTDSGRLGSLEIAEVRISMLDGHGGPLPSPIRLADGTPLDGTALQCPSAFLSTEPLQWGSYLVQVDAATADGTVCYSTDPAKHPEGRIEPVGPLPAAPLESSTLVVPRIYEVVEIDEDGDGETEQVARPPAGCEDCDPAGSDGCGEGNACIQGICVSG